MNILEALEVALPELPRQSAKQRFPQLDPRIIAREHVELGVPTVLAKVPGADNFIRFTPEQWKLIQLFDGHRSFAEIGEQSVGITGGLYSETDVRELAAFLQDNTDVFYKTPLEQNVTLHQKLRSQRQHRRGRFHDLGDVPLADWKRADDYL